jgi:hypothetical protein
MSDMGMSDMGMSDIGRSTSPEKIRSRSITDFTKHFAMEAEKTKGDYSEALRSQQVFPDDQAIDPQLIFSSAGVDVADSSSEEVPLAQSLRRKAPTTHMDTQKISSVADSSSEEVPLARTHMSSSREKGKSRAADKRLAHQPQDQENTSQASESESDHGHLEPAQHTQKSDHSSQNYVVPEDDLEALVDAVIVSKNPNQQFRSAAFLQSIGVTDNSTVVIADKDFHTCTEYLASKKLERDLSKKIYKTLYLMTKIRKEEGRARNRRKNMSATRIEKDKRRKLAENMDEAQKLRKKEENQRSHQVRMQRRAEPS